MNKDNNIEFSDLTLREIGLEVDANGHIVDEESGNPITMKGKYLKYNYGPVKRTSREEINYDPLNNPKLMNMLFCYYSNKLESEGSRGVDMYSTNLFGEDKVVLKAKVGDNTIQSEPYLNESVRIMDVVLKMNDSTEDISVYDAVTEPIVAKKRKSRSK